MGLHGAHIISVAQFERTELDELFDLAAACEPVARGQERSSAMAGRLLANLFYEPSTRTRLSFDAAFQRLGGAVQTTVGMQFSSMAKGETLEDTIRVVNGYADVICMRHPERGSAARAAAVSSRPILNAGDGPGEHPSQALLDAWTLNREFGRVDGLRVALVGDLKYGRTVHSLARLLSRFDDVHLRFASPPALRMPSSVTSILDERGMRWEERDTIEEAIEDADVVYVTRLQAERFEDPAEAARLIGSYVVNRALLERCDRLDITIMHPLPRLHDLATDVDDLPGAAWFRQAHNGVPVRMALFCAIFGVRPT